MLEEEVPGRVAVAVGWEVLPFAMRSWGIQSKEDLSEWIHNQGFPRPRWGAHFSGRVQERIWNAVIARDARGVARESFYVHIVMQAWLGERPMDIEEHQPSREQEQARNATGLEFLDNVDLNRVFDSLFSVLQGCPAVYRRRFKQAVRVALARHSANASGDRIGELRGWKLFLLIPFSLLRRPGGDGLERRSCAERPRLR